MIFIVKWKGSETLIEVREVFKKIDDSEILKNITLQVRKGSVLGLIGPNGAGKTTLIKLITGIWQLDQGSIKVNGWDVFDNTKAKELMGYVSDQSHLYDSYKVKEMVLFFKLAYQNFSQKKFDELNRIFGIPLTKKVQSLSKGMKTKLSFMLNLSTLPQVLIMDEPTSGLDPMAKRQFTQVLLEDVADRSTTVLISSHHLSDLEQICDNIAVINKGEIKSQGSVDEIKHKIQKLQAVFPGGMPDSLLKNKDILNISHTGSIYYIITRNHSDDFKKELLSAGATLVEEINMNLEDVFVYSFGGDIL
ncbi:MAG: ABC transporter ATP-binding protein [Clostridia bacterium]|nr:ABC transporter ATP-binding protein [Clostridia bacterium]